MEAHGPYDAPPEDVAPLQEANLSLDDRDLTSREQRAIPEYMQRTDWFGPSASLADWRLRYAAGVRQLDRVLTPLLDILSVDAELNNVLTILVGDHGEQLLERGRLGHGFGFFDFDVHVPLLMRLPGGEGGGTRRSELVGLVDILPTVFETSGVDPADMPDLWAGRSLLHDGGHAEVVFSAAKWRPGLRGLRTDRYKLVADFDTEAVRLYDLQRDTAERRNLAEQRPEVVRRLLRRLREIEENDPPRLPHGGGASISDEARAQLEALGYL